MALDTSRYFSIFLVQSVEKYLSSTSVCLFHVKELKITLLTKFPVAKTSVPDKIMHDYGFDLEFLPENIENNYSTTFPISG